jgi:hypothetical protein
MAMVRLGGLAAQAEAVSSVTVSLTQGWDEIPANGPPSAGDLVLIEVIEPKGHVDGPPGWERIADGSLFGCVIGPHERDPVFCAVAPDGWEVRGVAFNGYAPWSDDGSEAPLPALSAGAYEFARAMELTWHDRPEHEQER